MNADKYPDPICVMTLLKVFIVIAFLSLCLPPTHAQVPSNDAKTAETARREKAVELLESLAMQVAALQSPENRARIGANIAESLWKHDEKRARALFLSIENDINLGLQNRELVDDADRLTAHVFMKLRGDTVQRLAKYDPEFAWNFLKATEPQAENLKRMFPDKQRDLEIQLARQMAAANPDLALKLGRQALARGFSDNLLSLLRQLHRKERDKGVILYREAVQKLRDTDLTGDWEALEFAQGLVKTLVPPVADETAFREVVNLFITSALANGCDKKPQSEDDVNLFCDQIASLVSTMEKVDPLRARKLKILTPDPDQADMSESIQRGYVELAEVAENGTVDEILALTEKYPGLNGTIYSRAMTKALESGDIELARKIANSDRLEPGNREYLTAQVERFASTTEITEQQLAEFQRMLDRVPQNVHRIHYLDQMANTAGAKNNKLGLKLLDQALDLVEGLKTPADKIGLRLMLATSYCSLGSDRGFEIVQSDIPKLNELIESAVKLDGFDTNYLRDGEWNMSANGSIGDVLTTLSQNAGYFAWCDFDRAVSLAGQFERNEIRIMAQVKLAQSILAAKPVRSYQMGRFYLDY